MVTLRTSMWHRAEGGRVGTEEDPSEVLREGLANHRKSIEFVFTEQLLKKHFQIIYHVRARCCCGERVKRLKIS